MDLAPASGSAGQPWRRPQTYWPALSQALTGHGQPIVTLDLTVLEHNLDELTRRADGVRIRVASKSARSRPVIESVLAQDGYGGILAYSLAEAVWASTWCEDVLMGYPSTDTHALAQLLADEQAVHRVTLMIDSTAHLDLIDMVASAGRRPEVRVAIDLDLAYDPPRAGRLPGRVGVYRSPVATARDAHDLASAVVARPGFRLVGVMGYEAQIAGVGDQGPAQDGTGPLSRATAAAQQARTLVLRRLQADSWGDVLERRSAMVTGIRAVAEEAGTPLELVNGGGTGSVHLTRQDPSVTEIAAGSGLFGPTLFDRSRAFSPAPAAAFALPVVRRPAADIATVAGGGWIASGPPGPDRLPRVVWPGAVQLVGNEGAGEVQTPLRGPGAAGLSVGDLTWWRHAKAGELSEHTHAFTLVRSRVSGGDVEIDRAGTALTYRGEGKAFG
ncbi:alanine racemase [Ornithinimicrobium sp. Y1694]|uniref:alanine racemase n=1 Tax=Ornithinimicrobium sp. Y1694 TaxID=3418590 RepID=UPI003CFB8679